jgi:hypothetical protein
MGDALSTVVIMPPSVFTAPRIVTTWLSSKVLTPARRFAT